MSCLDDGIQFPHFWLLISVYLNVLWELWVWQYNTGISTWKCTASMVNELTMNVDEKGDRSLVSLALVSPESDSLWFLDFFQTFSQRVTDKSQCCMINQIELNIISVCILWLLATSHLVNYSQFFYGCHFYNTVIRDDFWCSRT